jgi:hypothetical protein
VSAAAVVSGGPNRWGAWRIEIVFAHRRPPYANATLNMLPRSRFGTASQYDVQQEFRELNKRYASGREQTPPCWAASRTGLATAIPLLGIRLLPPSRLAASASMSC